MRCHLHLNLPWIQVLKGVMSKKRFSPVDEIPVHMMNLTYDVRNQTTKNTQSLSDDGTRSSGSIRCPRAA